MPYKLKKEKGGYKVISPNHPKGFSKKPLSKKMAKKQLAALHINTHESLLTRVRKAIVERDGKDWIEMCKRGNRKSNRS